jgi:hypothetical protein
MSRRCTVLRRASKGTRRYARIQENDASLASVDARLARVREKALLEIHCFV